MTEDPPHGTTYRYRGKGCRCDDCRAAWRRSLEYNRREPDDPLDGDEIYARSHGIPRGRCPGGNFGPWIHGSDVIGSPFAFYCPRLTPRTVQVMDLETVKRALALRLLTVDEVPRFLHPPNPEPNLDNNEFVHELVRATWPAPDPATVEPGPELAGSVVDADEVPR